MTRKIAIGTLAALTLLGACAPLSQAGLVYTSRAQVGVNVAGGTPETPGFNLNIGMNVNDSAYIPVVVGRPCELTNRTNCNQALVLVRGNSDVGDTRASDDDGELDTSPVRPSGQANPGSKSFQPAAAPASAAAQAQQAAADAQVSARVSAQEAARAVKITNQSMNNRGDALSVYGTFDSNGNASSGGTASASAGLRLGRIFSTGVASQNLTEGQRDALRADSLTRCIAQATGAAEAGDVRNQLLTACAAALLPPPR